MKKYILHFRGYEISPHNPFSTITAARLELRKVAQEEKQEAKRRWRSAHILWNGKNSYSIHATRERQSPLWSECTILAI